MANYETKSDLRNATVVETSDFTKKADLASLNSGIDKSDVDKIEKVPIGLSSLKTKLDKLDVAKLVPVSLDLSNLSNVVKNNVVKDTEYDQLVKKVNDIKTTDTSDLVKNIDYNTKLKRKLLIMMIVNILLYYYWLYITTVNTITTTITKLTVGYFAARLKQAHLASKNDIDDFLKRTDFGEKLININKKVTSNKTEHELIWDELKVEQDEIMNLRTYHSSLFIGQIYFVNNGSQNLLIFQPILNTFSAFWPCINNRNITI